MLYIESLVIIGCINVVAVCGLVLLVGYTGIFSMGHAGFMAIGGYAAALLYLSPPRTAISGFGCGITS